MAKNNETTTKFKVDISELKKSMQEAKRQVSIANSEFKAVSSSMDNWAKSSEGLKAKLKQLDTNLNSQKTILSNLERQYELTVQEMGEGSAAADKLKVAINNQKATINTTEREIRTYTDELNKAERAEDIAAKTGRNAAEVFDELGKEAKNSSKQAKESTEGFTVLKGAIASLAADGIKLAISGAKKLASALIDLGVQADDLNTLSKQSGFTTDMLQKMDYAADRIDVDMSTIIASAKKLKKNMTSNSADTAAAWDVLGISLRDANGELRDSTTVFFEVVKALSKVNNETERDTLAMQLFGRGADELAGIIDDGGAALNTYGKEAEELGVILSQDTLNAANKFNDSVDKIKATTRGTFAVIGGEIAGELAPELEILAKEAQNAAKKIDWRSVVKSVVGVLKNFVKLVKSAATTILPKLVKVLGFVANNFDALVKVLFTGVTVFKTLKAAMAISNTITAFKTATAAATGTVGLATKAQTLWNASMNANPIGAVVTAVALLTAGIFGLVKAMGQEMELSDLLNDSQRKTVDGAREAAQSYNEKKEASHNAAQADLEQLGYVTRLWQELDTLANSSGEVKAEDKARAEFILGELNNALGTEYTMTGNIIDNYATMRDEIAKVIEAKKAQILLTAYEETYKDAILNVAEAEKARAIQAQELAKEEERNIQLKTDAEKKYAAWKSATDERDRVTARRMYEAAQKEYEASVKRLNEKKQAYIDSSDAVRQYYNDIETYESASSAVIAGETDKAVEQLTSMGAAFTKAADLVDKSAEEQKKILAQQVVDTEVQLQIMQKDYDETQAAMTEEQRKQAQLRLEAAREQAEAAKLEYEKVGGNIVKGIVNGVSINGWILTDEMKTLIESSVKAAQDAAEIHSPSRLFKREVGRYIGLGIAAGVDDSTKDVVRSVNEQMNTIRRTYGAVNAGLSAGIGFGMGAGSGVVNNLTQNIYSPKAPSRLEIYRQTKNLLGYVGGV